MDLFGADTVTGGLLVCSRIDYERIPPFVLESEKGDEEGYPPPPPFPVVSRLNIGIWSTQTKFCSGAFGANDVPYDASFLDRCPQVM